MSGIAIAGTGLVWGDDSLAAEVFSLDPSTSQFTGYPLANCNPHPHDGLNVDAANSVWWDEEFTNSLGRLTP